MEGTHCPKCGSDQVLNDQCLKCGVVVSKHRGTQASSAPVSFVAPPAPTSEPHGDSYAIPHAAVAYQETLRKGKLQTRMIGVVALVAVVLGGYFLFQFFRQQASGVSGLYKNQKMIFAFKFPESKSAWHHYYTGQLDSPLYRDVGDAFYRGKRAGKPEIVLGVWMTGSPPIPENLDPAGARKLLVESEDELLQQMVDRGIDCTITDSTGLRVGGNDGFRMDADVTVEGKPLKLIAVRGHYIGQKYWVFISGTEEEMSANRSEIEHLISSMSYKMSMF